MPPSYHAAKRIIRLGIGLRELLIVKFGCHVRSSFEVGLSATPSFDNQTLIYTTFAVY